MEYTVLLNTNENTKAFEIKEQSRFIKSVIETLEVPIEFNPDEPLTAESKIKFVKSLSAYNISIIDDMDGGLKVYVDADLVAEWYKCKYQLKQDRTKIDPKKRLFLEASIKFTTVFSPESKEGT